MQRLSTSDLLAIAKGDAQAHELKEKINYAAKHGPTRLTEQQARALTDYRHKWGHNGPTIALELANLRIALAKLQGRYSPTNITNWCPEDQDATELAHNLLTSITHDLEGLTQ